jgi:RimJ/RimL family protein N-acetyltransferase
MLLLPGGERVAVRFAGPDDAEMLQAYVRQLSAKARYNRFFGPLIELSPAELDRVMHINGPNHATLIAQTGDSKPVMIGELRHAVLSETTCEFSISVADDWYRKGLGHLLLRDLQCRMQAQGIKSLVGDVLRSNEAMLAFARKAGFRIASQSRDPRSLRIVRDICPARALLASDVRPDGRMVA